MAKTLLTKHEVIIRHYMKAVSSDKPKRGDLVEHKGSIKEIYFYAENGETNSYQKVTLSRSMVLELADKIREIEATSEIKPWDGLPPF